MKDVKTMSLALLVTFALMLPLIEARADDDFKFHYAAKFVCGRDPQPAFVRVVPGFYATAVAIHNPNKKLVDLRKKVVLTFPPEDQAPGQVSAFFDDSLAPNEALQVDCEEIFGNEAGPGDNPPALTSQFFPDQGPDMGFPPYIQGFVIIESTHSVDVSAVLTAGEGTPADANLLVRSIHMEQIRERKIDGRR